MRRLRAFTLLELLTVIAIIVLLVAVLLPALTMARKVAYAALCQSKLHHWNHIWFMFTEDNGGYFPDDIAWISNLQPYYKDEELLCCPAKMKYDYSYGINGFITNPPTIPIPEEEEEEDESARYWRTPNVKGAAGVPMFLDCDYLVGWPKSDDKPPQWDDESWVDNLSNNMLRFCRNRHNAAVNSAFLDFSVRKTGLKQLWTLKWHKNYDINGPWTIAGGVTVDKWPAWMRRFRDY